MTPYNRRVRLTSALTVALIALATSGSTQATAAPLASGSFAELGNPDHPFPLRHTGSVFGHWQLRVDSVTPRANRLVKRLTPLDPLVVRDLPQDFMVLVTATYTGPDHARLRNLTDRVGTYGKLKFPMVIRVGFGEINDCGPGKVSLPPPDLQPLIGRNYRVASGQSVHGHICFSIAHADAASLRLWVQPPFGSLGSRWIWFALH